jgi:hypothetical protein
MVIVAGEPAEVRQLLISRPELHPPHYYWRSCEQTVDCRSALFKPLGFFSVDMVRETCATDRWAAGPKILTRNQHLVTQLAKTGSQLSPSHAIPRPDLHDRTTNRNPWQPNFLIAVPPGNCPINQYKLVDPADESMSSVLLVDSHKPTSGQRGP